MCGRYAATANPDELVEEFEVDEDHTGDPARGLTATPQQPPPGHPDHNLAPTKLAPVVLTRRPRGSGAGTAGARGDTDEALEPTRQLRLLAWGLVPSWAKDTKVGLRMINARAETVLEKPAYARAAAARRLLVPAHAYYEWQASPVATDAKGKPRKQPFAIARADGDTLAFAGLYEFWRDRSVSDDDPGAWLTTFTIITTAAEPGLDRIHDRQPHVLERDQWAAWLDPDLTDLADVAALLAPHEPGRFTAYPVSRAVNSVRNNGPQLLTPAPESDLAGVIDPTTGEVIGG